ncbi:OmpA family protein [Pseudomonas sp. ABY48]|uniref:OmpA family protein n=1 Tax=Pseudomonas sp. ABY48 TaxID=3402865 RepID=UPI003B42CCFE
MTSVAAMGGFMVRRRAARLRKSVKLAANVSMPPASFRHPVVLVCGDGLDGLFGTIPAQRLTLRVTHQGCYVRVPTLDQLPNVTERILALRPGWGAQLSVMFMINPAAHSDAAVLAGRLQTFRHQVALAGRLGASLPLMLVSYFHGSQGETPWFCWVDGQPNPRVRDAGACVGMADWLQQPSDSSSRMMRMQAGVQLNNATAWLHDRVLPYFNTPADNGDRDWTVSWALKRVPALPQTVQGNLWERWLLGKVALVDARPAVAKAKLPFPDPLLSLIPLRAQRTHVQRAGIIAAWMFGVAGAVALVSSAWQNALLLRQVSDDLRRYALLLKTDPQAQRTALRTHEAETVLRETAHRLETYYRQGEPLALGLGLYRGGLLREPVEAALSSQASPGAMPGQAPEPLRLDSLSLFSPGSAQLKPDSTKVLVKALVGLKAQPGWLIVIAGHTDATGDAMQNLRLSRARAAAVHEWMLHVGGLPGSCFAVQGFGASQPIASNDTEAGRAANRRVDIRLVPEVGACASSTTATDTQPSVAFRDVHF